jgi:Fe-S oxidoreductase
MPVPIGSTLGIFADNSRLRKSVLPISAGQVSAWTKGLNIPRGGETVLYTGQMYQLVPLINSMSIKLAKFENSWITSYFGVGRTVNKFINLTRFMAGASVEDQAAYNQPLRNIALLLKNAGVEFGYLYEKDLYSGALVYDEGLDEAFAVHAKMIYTLFKDQGVKKVITVDPHTTNILRSIYPEVIQGFDLQIKSYLEVLVEQKCTFCKPMDQEVTIHDSCIYARHENMVEQPRQLLKQSGVQIQETELSGKLTYCCGGPLESLFPGKSTELATKRIAQLSDCAKQIVTLCPICMANLKRVAPPEILVRDISDYLVNALNR